MLFLLLSCKTESYPPCGEGLGRADNGICYPILTEDTAPQDSDADSDADSDSDSDADADPGDPITVSGNLTIASDLSDASLCSVAAWSTEDLSGGFPTPGSMPLSNMLLSCPSTRDVAEPYETSFQVGSAAIDIAIFGFIDTDGSFETIEDNFLGSYAGNPLSVTPGEPYEGVDIVVTPPALAP